MEGEDQPERRPRKSVTFTDEQIVVDAAGNVSTMSAPDETKDTALSHTPRTPPLSAALGAFTETDPSQAAATDDAPQQADDAAAPQAEDGLDLSMLKKKKKKKVVAEDGADGVDLTLKKKKKKAAKTDEDDFEAKLKQLEVKDDEAEAEAPAGEDGDPDLGTGIFAHDETRAISYSGLLSRFFGQLQARNPDHATSSSKTFKIPPPQCLREGNRKTIFANLPEICRKMNRSDEHLISYLYAELGTSGSVDGSRRLIIKGRFQQKQMETVVRKYIIEYVTCRTCKSSATTLEKAENRITFLQCSHCGSRRSVTPIKQGFSAQIGKRRRMQG